MRGYFHFLKLLSALHFLLSNAKTRQPGFKGSAFAEFNKIKNMATLAGLPRHAHVRKMQGSLHT